MTNEKITALENAIRTNTEKLAANATRREKVAAAVVDVEGEIAALKDSKPADVAGEIAHKREDLLAARALGDATDADLQAFDKDAASTLKKYAEQVSRQEVIKPLEASAAGLRRRIATLAAEKVALEAELNAAEVAYWTERAEQAGALVKIHGAIVRDAVAEVVACGSIIFALGVPNNLGVGYKHLAIPPLGTASTQLPPRDKYDITASTDLYSLGSDDAVPQYINPAQSALIDAAEAKGIRCPKNLRPVEKPVPAPVPEPAAVNINTKPATGVLASFVKKPHRPPGDVATVQDPLHPDAVRGPGWLDSGPPTEAER